VDPDRSVGPDEQCSRRKALDCREPRERARHDVDADVVAASPSKGCCGPPDRAAVDRPLAGSGGGAHRESLREPNRRDTERPPELEEVADVSMIRGGDDVVQVDRSAAPAQEVDGAHRALPAPDRAPGAVVQLRRRPVDRNLDVEARNCAEPCGDLLVHEPAVRVHRHADAGRAEPLDQLERELAPKKRLPTCDNGLEHTELDRLLDDPAPHLVGEVEPPLARRARGVRVTERTAQVAECGQLELHADRPNRRSLARALTRVAQPMREPAQPQALAGTVAHARGEATDERPRQDLPRHGSSRGLNRPRPR
jgi:hypothetical protein